MLTIRQIGDPVLRQAASALSKKEILSPPIQELIVYMKETMYAAPGVGLAAPQIGESLQVLVIEDRAEYMQHFSAQQLERLEREPVALHVLINPTITLLETEGERTFFEGCLSVAGFIGLVSRAACVEVTALNERAEPVSIRARGWYARILQHEIDHLHGTVCIDRAHHTSWMTVENYIQFWREKPIEEIYAQFGVRTPFSSER